MAWFKLFLTLIYFSLFFRVQRTRPSRLQILEFFPEYPERDQISEMYTPKRDDEHPRLFHIGVPLPGFSGLFIQCTATHGAVHT